jgi:ketosteroid isomerase-like protein
MIEVSRRVPVNEPGQPVLTRADVWRGLVMKADNALPFVPAMTYCQVVKRETENSFVREIEFRGERCHERVTLTPEQHVLFERLDGSVLGTIRNSIEEDQDGLGLRFSFSLKLAGEADGSPAEKAYGQTVEKDYLKAVDATLAAIRKMKRETTGTLERYYTIVDSMDLTAFKAMHTDDAVVQFANFPLLVGPDAIAGAIGHFWSTIGGLKHDFVNRWDTGKETILEVKVDYTRKDGAHVVLPCVSILELRDGKVANLRVHIDTAPIYAEAAAVAA